MPIVDVLVVMPLGSAIPPGTAQELADAVATVLHAEPGRVWARVNVLPESQYAENQAVTGAHPVFLKVLHASLPSEQALAIEAKALAAAVGATLGRPPERVHVEYSPPGRGRVAFGGQLLR
jgi:phenylpyruvate tautomerase PptA (4-oxalocrotonate tautomerase family)